MKKAYLLFLFSLFLFSSCDKDDNTIDEKDKITITAEMKYRSGNDYLPDEGAFLYLFKDFTDYINYSYVGNGVYKNEKTGTESRFTQKATANKDGIATFNVDWGQHSLVVWESAHISGKFGQNVYDIKKGQNPITISEIYFEP